MQVASGLAADPFIDLGRSAAGAASLLARQFRAMAPDAALSFPVREHLAQGIGFDIEANGHFAKRRPPPVGKVAFELAKNHGRSALAVKKACPEQRIAQGVDSTGWRMPRLRMAAMAMVTTAASDPAHSAECRGWSEKVAS